jgi:ABC-2 type transport system ATP-binding protein
LDSILKLEKISKKYGKKPILSDFSLNLEKGNVYGLLGINGVGKTTLMRIIMGVIPPDSGKIFYKNSKLRWNDTFYKKEVAYIPEEAVFYSGMRVDEFINFNSVFYPKWNHRKAQMYQERFFLPPKSRIRHLSRGMKLKLGLLVALAAEPELLVLDDPTSGLDVPTRQDFLMGIIQEIVNSGTTILFASHLIHELEGIVKYIGILHQGRLYVDENFNKIKESIKRVRMKKDKNSILIKDIEGLLQSKEMGDQIAYIFFPWSPEKEKKIVSMFGEKIKIEPMTLEEIFLAFISSIDHSFRGASCC